MYSRKSEMRTRSYNETPHYTSELTMLVWLLQILVFFYNLIFGVPYLFSTNDADFIFGFFMVIEASFCLIGLLFLDPINHKPMTLKPEKFKPIETDNFLYSFVLGLLLLFLLQFLYQPATVPDWQRGLAVIAASVGEESFFRAVILQVFINLSLTSQFTKYEVTITNVFSKEKEKVTLFTVDFYKVIGLIVSVTAFTLFHYNYYAYPMQLFIISLSGVGLALIYLKWENLTGVICAHLLLNLLVTINSFGLLNF